MTTAQLARKLARNLRNNPTEAEKLLWQKLRKRQFMEYKFLRQHPVIYRNNEKVNFFIADFYCHELRLIIEVDGEIHRKQEDYDDARTEILNMKKFYVKRFLNKAIFSNINKVLIETKKVVDEIKSI